MIYFVDLTESPRMPIRHRCVPSSVYSVSALSAQAGRGNANRIVPDDTESRFWVRAQSRREALEIARGRVS